MSLDKAPVKTSGLCAIKIFRIEDVKKWPDVNPQSGIIENSIQLKEGAFLYFIEAADAGRSYTEDPKESVAGNYVDIEVNGNLRGSNAANILSLQTMFYHQWGIIVQDRNGVNRLIGNADCGADLLPAYNSGDRDNSRRHSIKFKWQHIQPAPVYQAQSFDITIGGVQIVAGQLQLVIQFQVGSAGAPMNDGDTILINNLIKDKYVLILVDGISLPIDYMDGAINWTGSIQRRVEKALASNTANFIGAVRHDETIEVYAFS